METKLDNTTEPQHDAKLPVIRWVVASEKLPSVEQNGNKVLIYRIMNDSQESLAISIHETSMVKYCNVDETWWMELPKPPCL